MTTIAYRDGVMACDSCWSENKAVDSLMSKITRLSSGALLGQAGDNDSREVVRLLDKVKTPAGLPLRDDLLKIRLDYMGLLVFPKGRMFKVSLTHISEANWTSDFDEDVGAWEISGTFTAIGSGKEFAIGALEFGASAQNAVRIACRRDINSRGPVHAVKLTQS